MILEVAIMKIKPELMAEFETVFPQAAAISASTPGYISHEMQRCVETKGKYFYLIRWESIEAHEVNFRQSPRRAQRQSVAVGVTDDQDLVRLTAGKPDLSRKYQRLRIIRRRIVGQP